MGSLRYKRRVEEETKFFWHYEEADCWVAPGVVNIPAIDKANSVLWKGDRWVSTEVFTTAPPYTVDEYHQKYCKWNEEVKKWIYN